MQLAKHHRTDLLICTNIILKALTIDDPGEIDQMIQTAVDILDQLQRQRQGDPTPCN